MSFAFFCRFSFLYILLSSVCVCGAGAGRAGGVSDGSSSGGVSMWSGVK